MWLRVLLALPVHFTLASARTQKPFSAARCMGAHHLPQATHMSQPQQCLIARVSPPAPAPLSGQVHWPLYRHRPRNPERQERQA